MDGTKAQSHAHLGYVDGLRAVAILSVILFHSQKYADLAHGPFKKIWYTGMHGVDLFFVISGLCLSFPFLRAVHSRGEFRFAWVEYLAKRIVRILPIFWIAIAVFTALSLTHEWYLFATQTHVGAPHIGPVAIVKNLFFLDGATSAVNGSFWTLAVEFRWYFLFPIVLTLWVKAPRVFFAVLALCAIYLPHTRLHDSTDLRTLPGFMSGIVAADAIFRPKAWMRFAPLLAIVAFVAVELFTKSDPRGYAVSFPWQVVCFLFVLAAINSRILQSILSFKPLEWIGLASYSIYLFHEPFLAWLESVHHVPAQYAIPTVLAIGFVMWALFERTLTTASIRIRLVAWVQSGIVKLLPLLQVPAQFTVQISRRHSTIESVLGTEGHSIASARSTSFDSANLRGTT